MTTTITTSTMAQTFDSGISQQNRSLSPRTDNEEAATSTSTSERFPSFDESSSPNPSLPVFGDNPQNTGSNVTPPTPYKWPSRRGSYGLKGSRSSVTARGHRAKRSLSDAINNFRNRRGSVSDNAQEIAEALKAPVSYRLIALCIIWYMTSAFTNTSSKSILNAFPQPVTLTIVQFLSVAGWCFVLTALSNIFPQLKVAIPALKNGLRKPSWDVLQTALPLSVFQLLGHLLSSYATSKIPVSLVHTIKGLSPLFTVVAYRAFFRIRYARATYLSLVPLTVGVMLACSTDFSANLSGITAALVAAVVFVTQNIFSKKLFNEASRIEAEGQTRHRHKLDKLNLLCYCSVGAFLFSAPVWLYTEGFGILQDFYQDGTIVLSTKAGSLDHGALTLEFVFNGVFHFLQNIMAFILLSMLSPVSYSVASLIKRVWVIVLAVIWFRSSTTKIQLIGIGLTMVGLYLYDRTSMEDAAERKAKQDHFHSKSSLLPVAESPERKRMNGHALSGKALTPMTEKPYEFPANLFKRDDDTGRPTEAGTTGGWLPPGTKQESTWTNGDQVPKP